MSRQIPDFEEFQLYICPKCKYYGLDCFNSIEQSEIRYTQIECYNDYIHTPYNGWGI